MIDLANMLGYPGPRDTYILAICHLPSRTGTTSVFSLKFTLLGLRNRWLKASAGFRFLADDGALAIVFFNENFTHENTDHLLKA